MTTITFILKDGSRRSVEAGNATNVMEAATSGNLPGIDGACGGFCSCATCHVYVDSPHALPPLDADEDDMLDATAAKRRKNSRLACQIKVTQAIGGLVLRVPDKQ